MKQMAHLFLSSGVIGALMLTAWSGVYAARSASENDGHPLFANFFSSRVLGSNTHSTDLNTEKSDIVETPRVTEGQPDQGSQNATAEVNQAPQVGEDHQGSEGQKQGTSRPENNGEVNGTVTALDASTITVDGVVYNLANFSEVKGTVQVGDTVKLEFSANPDGTLTVTEAGSNNDQNNLGDSNNSNSSSGDSRHRGSNSAGNSNSHGNGEGGNDGPGSGGGHGGGDGGSDG